MNTQQEIAECEQELSSLLGRVLAGTLKPMEASLSACEQRLTDVETNVGALQQLSQEVSLQQQNSQRDLKRLKSQTEDGHHETVRRMGEILAESQISFTSAQARSTELLGEGLQRCTDERAVWIARTLGSQMDKGMTQHGLSVVESRDLMIKHALALQAGSAAIERRLAELGQHFGELGQTARRLEAASEAVQRDVSEGRHQVAALHEESVRQSRAAIEAALRPVRHMLAAALSVATGALILGAASHWSMFLK